ncbi:long-chain fatty acid--CoA ligase [Rhodopseudomonas palustris]|uniref:acyl-CoA synthetase n=1 Tax=Rhodopseudomonas palustris TaxID=1076 RepID=UPI002ACD508F|nr:long-chain fatty acid--CoA ligase [Rhodopseudomonas palustris]WQG97755.1 long-chain fatty acid--CoA ligase [Rhodopseudomonas palustris]
MSFAYFDWITHHAEARPDRIALIDLTTQRTLTYRVLDERVDRLAAHLATLGVGRGDRVAVLAANTTDTLEVQFACFRLGAIFVPLNVRLTVHELAFIVGDAAPRVLAHDTDFAAMAGELQSQCAIAHLLQFGEPYEAALAASPRLDRAEAVTLDDVSTIMYTSGTTGKPKGAMITHGMTFINAVNLGIPAFISQRTVFLCVMPLFHTGGLNCYTNPVLHAGGTVILMRAFDPGETLKIIGDASIGLTHFFGVPSIYQFMCQHPAFADTDLSRLQLAGVGGAPMPVPLLRIWQDRGCVLVQGYGMTETSPAVLILDSDDAARKAGSAGKPVLHADLKIVGPDGEPVQPGEMGELWVKGPNITPGYWNRPEANRTSFTDGWLHTGDAARVDDEGFYYIVDRTKDMYISGGENVYPAEVEDVLYQLPEIAEAAVIGAPDPQWGETGVAIVAVKSGRDLSESKLHTHCRERLARFKCPQRVIFVEALPRNATGKVHKPTLRERFLSRETADA